MLSTSPNVAKSHERSKSVELIRGHSRQGNADPVRSATLPTRVYTIVTRVDA
jgi:hypothetical protein